ncbi:hypothetical protein FRB95_013467 [Tulasnella sp. JGI-2019a]|nr:hypothetical protein FRB95_013467 [Tulasnella sp. JGI-2019a]
MTDQPNTVFHRLTGNVDIAAGTEVTIGVRGSAAYSGAGFTFGIEMSLPTILIDRFGCYPIKVVVFLSKQCGQLLYLAICGGSVVHSECCCCHQCFCSRTSAAVAQSSLSIAFATFTSTAEGSSYSGRSFGVASASDTTYTPTSQSTTSTTGGLVAQTNTPDSPPSSDSKSTSKTIAIAVGAVAGFLAIAVAVLDTSSFGGPEEEGSSIRR